METHPQIKLIRAALEADTLDTGLFELWGADESAYLAPTSDKIVTVSQETKWVTSFKVRYLTRPFEYAWVYETAELTPGMVVLDTGCALSPLLPYCAMNGMAAIGADSFTTHLIGWDREQGLGGEYKRIDSAYAFACFVLKLYGVNVAYYEMNMTDMAFLDGTFDRVFCISVFEHMGLAARQKAVSEMWRVLKPGGKVVLTIDYVNYRTQSYLNVGELLAGMPFPPLEKVIVYSLPPCTVAIACVVLEKPEVKNG